MSTSTLNISTTQPPNRSIESDLPFGARYPTLTLMNTRNIPPNHPPPPPPYSHGVYNINPYVEGYSQRQVMFRSLHESHPPSSYSSGTESISQPPMPSPSATVTMPPQPKQSSLRFGFPDHQESRDREVDVEDEDDGSSTNSYDATSSRKRARSFSNEWAIPPQPQIQFGSIDPVSRSRQVTNHNHNHNLRTSSSPLPAPNRPPIETRIPIEYAQEITNIPATSISQPSNFYYSSNARGYAYQPSSSTTASPPPIQMHQQPHFF
ncbi:13618_t:CDS:1, partial [Acaulospora morrowiae]